jgi:cation transport protein ChaC
VRGWGRRFAQHSTDHRGTPERPGLVATLLPDAELERLSARDAAAPASRTCGVCYRVGADERRRVLANLDFREKGGYTQALIDVEPRDGRPPVRALLYSATADNPGFRASMLADEAAAAAVIGTAHGPSGANREYLVRLAEWLAEVSERDPHIERLVSLMPPPGQ